MKKIDKSAHIGGGAIALIHQHVHEMGFVWHERKTGAVDLYLTELDILDEEPGCDVILVARPEEFAERPPRELDPEAPWKKAPLPAYFPQQPVTRWDAANREEKSWQPSPGPTNCRKPSSSTRTCVAPGSSGLTFPTS